MIQPNFPSNDFQKFFDQLKVAGVEPKCIEEAVSLIVHFCLAKYGIIIKVEIFVRNLCCTMSFNDVQDFSAGLDQSAGVQDRPRRQEGGESKTLEEMSLNRGGLSDTSQNDCVGGVLTFACWTTDEIP